MISADLERTKLETDRRHILYGKVSHKTRLKSREIFLKYTNILTKPLEQAPIDNWKHAIGHTENDQIQPVKHLPAGHDLDWSTWRTFNRLRVGVGRSKDNLRK